MVELSFAQEGRSHTLRIIREILFFERRDAGRSRACPRLFKHVMTRRVSCLYLRFQTSDFSRELSVSGRRHDFIALHIRMSAKKICRMSASLRWKTETGEQIEINTATDDPGTLNALAETHRPTQPRRCAETTRRRVRCDWRKLSARASFVFNKRERRMAYDELVVAVSDLHESRAS